VTYVLAIFSLLGGLALGAFFYGGLWFTVQRLPGTAHPVLFILGSYWLRLFGVLAAFVFLARQGLECAAIAMAGFVLGRIAVSNLINDRRARCP